MSVRFPIRDLSEFTLPGLSEEEVDGSDFRPRSGSAGLRSLIKFRTRNKSGDNKNSQSDSSTGDDKQKGIKGFLDSLPFRPRSKSDAAGLKQAAMMRKKHASGGGGHTNSNSAAGIKQVLTDNQHAQLSASVGDLEPVQRTRSTSLGAKDRLRMMKDMRISGAAPANSEKSTLMGKLMSNGLQDPTKANGTTNHQQTYGVNCGITNGSDGIEHQYTGQALIWESTDPDDEEAKTDSSYLDRVQVEDIEVNDPMVFNKFMRAHKCYDIVPTSSKLVIFDTSLSVKKAFYAMVYNGVRAAPLWDHKKQSFIGMLTISDFIFILHKYYKSPTEKMKELEEHQISSWRQELAHKYQPFVSISPEAKVCEAVRKLKTAKVHRLPVIDPVSGNAVYIITHKRVLKFLHLFMKNVPKPAYMKASIKSLELGTYDNVAFVRMNSSIIEALSQFVKRRVSALPIVDDMNQVVDIYAKFDVINLAAEKSYNDLDVPISQALSYRDRPHEGVLSCTRDYSLEMVVDKIVKAGVHRLVVTTPDGLLDGIISLSDILTFLLQEDDHLKTIASNNSCAHMNVATPAKQANHQTCMEV